MSYVTSVNVNQPFSGSTYNRAYTLMGNGSSDPFRDVADMGEGLDFDYLSTWQIAFSGLQQMPRSVRFMCNGDKIGFYLNANAPASLSSHGFRLSVDRVPVGVYAPTSLGQSVFHTVLFSDSRPRLIDIRTWTYLKGIYTQKPYELWKPPPRRGPRVLVIGDSWTSSSSVVSNVMNAAYWDIGPLIGSEDVHVDHFGGTGYTVGHTGNGGGGTSYLHRAENLVISGKTWDISELNPEIIVVHGGGHNDRYKGKTNVEVVAGVVQMFTRLRERCPNAKLVFVEGFTPPSIVSTIPEINEDFISIRQAAQEALAQVGVYYIDVATTRPWVRGLGTTAIPNSDGENSSIYVVSDGFHLNDSGHGYLRARIASGINVIKTDNGERLNQLISS